MNTAMEETLNNSSNIDSTSTLVRTDAQQTTTEMKKPTQHRHRHVEVLLNENEEILKKLESIKKTKAYEMLKYSNIQNMDASMVGEYLRSEPKHLTPVKSTGYEQFRQRIQQKTKDKAALSIQQYRWKNECPTERLRLIEEVSSRLARNHAPCTADLSVIKTRLMEWKQSRTTSAEEFEKRQLLMLQLKCNLRFLEQHVLKK
uniref:CUT domain-containing protein n=1 Tax=Syphacia muris TaxID=451379 RepID=A0A0N5AUP8_9BILA